MGLKSGSKTGKGGKQNSGKLNGGKFQLQNALREQDSDAEPQVDASVLRQSIDISVTGMQQAVKVYQTATEEIKNLLSNECDIIYECKVCRNLFRSLANFISHKRVYCKNSYCYSRHTVNRHRLVEDYTTVLQPEPAPCGSRDRQDWTTSDAVPMMSGTDSGSATTQIETLIPAISSYSKPKKDISQIVDNLSKKSSIQTVTETVGRISATHFYEDISKNLVAVNKDRKDHTIHLENMDTTRVAVFQTKLCTTTSTTDTENIDLMKAQVSEIQKMVSEGEATLDANGQVVMVNGHSSNGEGPKGGEPTHDLDPELGSIGDQQGSPKEDHVCSHCNMRFSTRKTLNHHMKSLHVTFRLWYPCPCCKNSFVNSWSVYRHLYKVHRKSTAQVRRLRPQIQKKAFKKDLKTESAPASPMNTSQSSALKEMQRLDQENQAWMDNFEDDQELQRCGGCGRRFERRAALASHSQICQKRIAARNNVKSRGISSATGAVNSPDKTAKQNGAVQTEIGRVKPAEPEDSSIEIIYVKSAMESGKKPELSVAPPLNSKPPMPSPTLSDNTSCSSNTMTFTRIRQTSGSWSEPTKKDIPEKRIEIQIRRDYCKMGSSSMNVVQVPENILAPSHASNESDSRPHSRVGSGSDSRPQSRIAVQEGEISDDFGREWGSVMQAEDQEKSELEQKQTRMKSIGVRMIKSVKEDKKNVSDTLGNLVHSGIKREVISQDSSVILQKIEGHSEIAEPLAQSNGLNGKTNEGSIEKNLHPLEMKGPENLRKRRASKELPLVENTSSELSDCKQQLTNPVSVMLQNSTVLGGPNKRRKQNPNAIRQLSMVKEEEEPMRIATKTLEQETTVDITLPKPRKLEQFSPVMEKRMLELINMRRLQCLPCQKKFNKLTNLRRHVAVHLGWSRYRCLVCPYKCFSKYDCVAHAHKVHLGTGVRAQAEHMVQYIEVQDAEEGKDAHSVTITNLGNFNKANLSHCAQKMCTEVLENNEVDISAKPLAITKSRNDRIKDSNMYALSKQTSPMVSPGIESCLKKLREQGIVEVTPVLDEDLSVTSEIKKEVPVMETTSPVTSDAELISNGEMEEGDDKNGLPVPGDDGVNEEPNLPTDGATSSSQEDQKIALRKMVMQVIFGGATANPNDNLIAVSINGDLLRRKSEGSKPRSISQTPESEIGEDPAGVERLCPSPAMSLPPGRSTGSTGSTPPKTGRDRPVRNRVRVEKEDFIYDLSDACLSPRKDADGQSYAAKTAAKRRQLESMRGELIKGSGVDNVSLSNNVDVVKCVPKLTLVRTESGESSGAKPAQVGAKSTWSNLYSSPSECNSGKGTIVNVAGYNISTRKSPRVFDTKPIKQMDSSKEKRVS